MITAHLYHLHRRAIAAHSAEAAPPALQTTNLP
jgi:hypothetical protein